MPTDKTNKIGTGGAFFIDRQLFNSKIWIDKPANWSKIWIYILGGVNWDNNDKNGIPRGTGYFNFIQEAPRIGTGIRSDIIKKCLRFLRDSEMISTTRSTRGVYLKVLKYNTFQNRSNNVSTSTGTRSTPKGTPKEALEKHLKKHSDNKRTIRTKELKKEINKEKLPFFENWLKYRESMKKPITNENTLELLVKRFNAESIEKIEWTVNNSIENSYQGLIWDNYKRSKNDFIVDPMKSTT